MQHKKIEQDTLTFEYGQNWLIDRMLALFPPKYVNKNGVCSGLSNMAMQAILADDLERFDKRLRLLHAIDVRDLKKWVEMEANSMAKKDITEEEKLLMDLRAFFLG